MVVMVMAVVVVVVVVDEVLVVTTLDASLSLIQSLPLSDRRTANE